MVHAIDCIRSLLKGLRPRPLHTCCGPLYSCCGPCEARLGPSERDCAGDDTCASMALLLSTDRMLPPALAVIPPAPAPWAPPSAAAPPLPRSCRSRPAPYRYIEMRRRPLSGRARHPTTAPCSGAARPAPLALCNSSNAAHREELGGMAQKAPPALAAEEVFGGSCGLHSSRSWLHDHLPGRHTFGSIALAHRCCPAT